MFFLKDIALPAMSSITEIHSITLRCFFPDTDHWTLSRVSGQLVSPWACQRRRWARSTVHRAPTFLCTPINTGTLGEGETKAASWSKCQSTLIGSPSSGVACAPSRGRGGGKEELGSDGVCVVLFGGGPRHFSTTPATQRLCLAKRYPLI